MSLVGKSIANLRLLGKLSAVESLFLVELLTHVIRRNILDKSLTTNEYWFGEIESLKPYTVDNLKALRDYFSEWIFKFKKKNKNYQKIDF